MRHRCVGFPGAQRLRVATLCWRLLVLALGCGWAGSVSVAQRIISLDGVGVSFEDVSAKVDVYFRFMRFNRALNEWNVEVTVSNKTSHVLAGPLLLLVEATQGTSGVLHPDGVDQGQAYFDLSGRLGDGVLSPSSTSLPRTIRLGPADTGVPQLVTRILAPSASVRSSLGLTRSIDEAGHPFPSVQVSEMGPAGPVVLQTDSDWGLVTLGQEDGDYSWRFSSPGYLPVWRKQTLAGNTVAVIPSPRLVPRADHSVTITPTAGGVVSNALNDLRLTFEPGSFPQPTPVTLTPLTAQTLPGLLPLGWSPLQAFWIEWDGTLTGTAPLRLVPWGRIEFGEDAVLARWNASTVRWEVAQTVPGNREGPLPFELKDPGAYAVVVADSGRYAPPAVAVGQPLPATLQPIPDLGDLTAWGTVTPSSSTASRNPELVTARAALTLSNHAALPSGLLLRCEVRDVYDLTSGSRLVPPGYETFIAAYQRPGDDEAKTLEAAFPMRPLLLLAEELVRATVTVDVLVPGPFRGGVLDPSGGAVTDGEIRLLAKAGDVASPRAIELRRLDPLLFSEGETPPLEVVLAFDLAAETLSPGKRFHLTFPPQPTNSLFVLARVLERKGVFGLEPVERFHSDTTGNLISSEPGTGERLPGVNAAGRFLLVRWPVPQGLIHGVARDELGQPMAQVPVRVTGQPWLTFSRLDGSYRLLAPAGEGTLSVVDPTGGSANLASFVLEDSALGTHLDVSASPGGPRVLSITPTDGMVEVPRLTPVVVEFSKPVQPSTLISGGLQLLDATNGPVAAALSLNLAGQVATLLPSEPLGPNAPYSVIVSSGVTDLAGRPLEGPATAHFTTQNEILDRSGAALTSYEPVDGQARLEGAPGTAEANAPVILVNETTGRTATVLSGPDGSFSNSIEAEVDDTLSAVTVNQNGTRNIVGVSRQLFADGSVGLFGTGGTLEVTSENGIARFVVEPGSIEKKSIFKVEALSLQETRELLNHVEPTNGMVLGGFKLAGVRGSSPKKAMELEVPINPALLPLKPGSNPSNATFGLVVPRVVEGQQVFELVDSLHYEEGHLVTHSPPFDGGLPDYQSDRYLLPVLIDAGPAQVVHGKVYSAKIDSQGNEQAPIQLLGGALVRAFSSGEPLVGRIFPGMVYAVTRINGQYSLLSVKNSLRATHPRFPTREAAGRVPEPPPGQTTPLNEFDLRFDIPESATDIPPEVSVTHLPPRQDPGKPIVVTELSTGYLSPPEAADPEILSIISLQPGQIVTKSDIQFNREAKEIPDPSRPNTVKQSFTIVCSQPAIVNLLFAVVDGEGNKTSVPHSIQFGGATLELPPDPIPVSDVRDHTGPRVLWSIPPAVNGNLSPGDPITIKFDEAINTSVLKNPAALVISPLASDPILTLSDDQTVLTARFLDLKPGTDYMLTVSGIQDLVGNALDQNPVSDGNQGCVISFKTGELPLVELKNPKSPLNEGVGAVVSGHYAFVLDRAPVLNIEANNRGGDLLVYDLRRPNADPVTTIALGFLPQDLLVIPHYPFRYAPESIYLDTNQVKQVKISDITEVFTKDLLVVAGGAPGISSNLRVYDISHPTKPYPLAATQLSRGESVPSRLRWSAPKLALLEVGVPDSVAASLQSRPPERITVIDLPAYLVGYLLDKNTVDPKPKTRPGRLGRDDNLDGDYVDDGEVFPLPPIPPLSFPGKEDSFGIADSTQVLRDFTIEERGSFRGGIVLAGYRLSETGEVLADDEHKLSAGYRTLLDQFAPVFLDTGFYPIQEGSPRRVFTLFNQLLTTKDTTAYWDLALISVDRPDKFASNSVLVLSLQDRLKPNLLFEVGIPKSDDSKSLYSFVQRSDGLLALASDKTTFLIDPARFGKAISEPEMAQQVVVGTIPGIGATGWSFGLSAQGQMVSARGEMVRTRAPVKPNYVTMPPLFEFVTFPKVDPFPTESWVGSATVEEIVDRLSERETAQSLRLARYEKEEGYCESTLKNPADSATRAVHYYVLVKANGVDPSKDHIDLALESLNWAAAPLRKRGFLFPPVHGFSADVLKPDQLGQEPGDEDAKVRPCRAWRLSKDEGSPLFNTFLSRPFALVAESLSKENIADLQTTLDRDILWSGNFLRVSIDPVESTSPQLHPFVGQVVNNRYRPGTFLTLPSLPGDLIQSPNPMPLQGGTTVALAGGFVGAHNSELIVDTVDLSIPGRRMPVSFGRHYSGQALHHGPFGRGWDINYNLRLVELSQDLIVPGYTNPVVVRADIADSEYATHRDVLFYNAAGRTFVYKWSGTNPPPEVAEDPLALQLKWIAPNQKPAANVSDYYLPPPGIFSPLVKFRDGRFATLDPDGTQHWFNQAGRLIKIYDRWEANSIELSYGNEGELVSIRSDGGTPTSPFHLHIGYFKTPSSTVRNPADIITTRASVAGRVCRLQDHTGRDVLFGYNEEGNLTIRKGAALANAASDRQTTYYSYSKVSEYPNTRQSLNEIRGPNRGADAGGVIALKAELLGPKGPDMVSKLSLGTMVIEVSQTHGNKALSVSGGQTAVKGPPADHVQTVVTYNNFDAFGRPKTTTVAGGGSADRVTEMTYQTGSGLIETITYPEKNKVGYKYDDDADSLRSRGNLEDITKDPGPRGFADTVTATTHYDPYYNLPIDQKDFRGTVTTSTLSADKRGVEAIKKGGEIDRFTYDSRGQLHDSTDPLGIKTTIAYTPAGFVDYSLVEDTVSGGDPLKTTYAYGNQPGLRGMPSSVTDPTQVSTTFLYDELDRVMERKRAEARETFAYDGAGNLIQTTAVVQVGTPDRVDTFEYDDYGNLSFHHVHGVEVTEKPGEPTNSRKLTTEYRRDAYFRVNNTILPSGEQQKVEFDHSGRVIKSWVEVGGDKFYERGFGYDKNGNLTTTTFGQRVSTADYDGHDRPMEQISAEGAKTTLTYDRNDNVLTYVVKDTTAGDKVLYSAKVTEYDPLDRPKEIRRETETGEAPTAIAYETPNRTIRVTDARGGVTTRKLDQAGRQWTETSPFGSLQASFQPASRELAQTFTDGLPQGPLKNTAHFTEVGYTDWIKDGRDQTYNFTPGTDGRLLAVSLPTSPSPFTTTYAIDGLPKASSRPNGQTLVTHYDERRNPVRQGPLFPDQQARGTTYSYDPVGRVKAQADALGQGDSTTSFNIYGQPLVSQLARGIEAHFTYDSYGRATNVHFSDSTTTRSTSYSQSFDALNRIVHAANASVSLDITYGKDGLPKAIGFAQFGRSYPLEQEFDAEGARTSLTYPDRTKVTFGRDDKAGRLTSLIPSTGGPVVQKAEYDAGPLVTHRIMGNGLIDLVIGYDANRRETSRLYQIRGPTVVEVAVSYERDDAGLITRRQLSRSRGTAIEFVADYFYYDDSQRLVYAVMGVTNGLAPASGDIPPGSYGRRFHFNNLDVMTEAVLLNPHRLSLPTFGGVVNSFDHNLFVTKLTFSSAPPVQIFRTPDEAGNTTQGRGFIRPRVGPSSQMFPGNAFTPTNAAYAYNELDQLVLVRREDEVTIANSYGPNGLRIRRTVAGPVQLAVNSDLEYLYDGDNLIEIRDFARNRDVRARFYYGDKGDELLAGDLFDPHFNGLRRFYYLTDSLGSPMAIVDDSGTVVEYYLYDAWGEATIRPPSANLGPGEPGIHTRSAIDSPFYFQGQVYDEDAGLIYMRARFYDPAMGVFLQRDPAQYEDSANLYVGLGANPINLRDPFGTNADDPTTVIAPSTAQKVMEILRTISLKMGRDGNPSLVGSEWFKKHAFKKTHAAKKLRHLVESQQLKIVDCQTAATLSIESYFALMSPRIPRGFEGLIDEESWSKFQPITKKTVMQDFLDSNKYSITLLIKGLHENAGARTLFVAPQDYSQDKLAKRSEASKLAPFTTTKPVRGKSGKRIDVRAPIDEVVRVYGKSTRAKVERSKLEAIPLAIGGIDYGMHSFVLSYGRVFEFHWNGSINDPNLTEESNIFDFLRQHGNPSVILAILPE